MLSTRSQNIAFLSTQDIIPLDSTHNSSFKTPARSLKHSRVVHDENSVYGRPKTIGFAGRKKQTVLFSTPAAKAHPRLATDKALRSANKSKALAEITNKTPFKKTPFPVTPGPASLKPSKSFAIFNDDSVVPSARRISSTRKKLRLPRSAIKTFETPDTKGNHWDVSDVSIEASMVEDTSVTEEEYGDVEYAPPTAIEPKFDPGIDMPDYKEVGATLMSLIRQPTVPDDHDPVTGFDNTVFFKELEPIVWEKLDLPEILPDPFSTVIRPKSSQTMVQGAQSSKVVCSKLPSNAGNLSSTRNAIPTSKPSIPNISCLSKPCTSRITHTRIPSLSKAKVTVTPPTTQTSGPTGLKSRTTSLGHARIISVPSRPTSVLHTRTGSIPSRTMTTTHTRSTNVASRPTAGSKPVVRVTMAPQRPRAISQLPHIPDDTVLSILAGSADESLGWEFLFQL